MDTLEGLHTVCPGDWIITGIADERYPCKPHIFENLYDEIEDDKPASPEPTPPEVRKSEEELRFQSKPAHPQAVAQDDGGST